MNNIITQVDYMPLDKLKKLQYETSSWKRMLDYMMEENVEFKIRLSKILKYKLNYKSLEDVENFQSKFIWEDGLILLLRNDVVEINMLLLGKVYENGKIKWDIERKLNQLRRNIIIAEEQFKKLRYAFYLYLNHMGKV